ncbi:MAG: GNAT family N-acetyltransferase [Bacteroidia bacterium]|nr:GNAT family N-acetyltransferase [Bacteroidia bacterium]
MEPIIREYRKGDFPEIMELWKITGLGNPQRCDNEDVIEKTITLGGKFLVMETDGKIIGTSWLSNDGRRIYLHHFGILPEFRRKGCGKLLLIESLKYIKQLNMQVKLEVHLQNYAAIELYKSAGFEYLNDYTVMIKRKVNE